MHWQNVQAFSLVMVESASDVSLPSEVSDSDGMLPSESASPDPSAPVQLPSSGHESEDDSEALNYVASDESDECSLPSETLSQYAHEAESDPGNESEDLEFQTMGRTVKHSAGHMAGPGVPPPCKEAIGALGLGRQHIAEYYSQPRVVPEAVRRGLKGTFSLDIITGWDLSCVQVQNLSLHILTHIGVMFLMLSPPCTAFSALMHLWNYPRMSPERAFQLWSRGMNFLTHAMQAATLQVSRGQLFAFEHPAGASSWKQECVATVRALPGVMEVTFDQCMLGLTSKVDKIPLRKRTRILTNCVALVRHLSGARCDRSHQHRYIKGSEGGVKRSKWAQVYPAGLVTAIADAVSESV